MTGIENWAFFKEENGGELCRYWQGTEGQARRFAQRQANELGAAVEFQTELSLAIAAENDESPDAGEIVQPLIPHQLGTDSDGQCLYTADSAEALDARGIKYWADADGLHEARS